MLVVVVVSVCVVVAVPPPFLIVLVAALVLTALVPYVVAELLCLGMRLRETGMRAENKWTKKTRESRRTKKGRIEKR